MAEICWSVAEAKGFVRQGDLATNTGGEQGGLSSLYAFGMTDHQSPMTYASGQMIVTRVRTS